MFLYLTEKDIAIWKKKVDWITKNKNMVLFISHPDYINFQNEMKFKEYPVKLFKELLLYNKEKYKGNYWHVLPKEIAKFWKKYYVK
ncbi:MAG: hypothetical protein JXN64_12025 [Spirochaetes bacterium]|nr:hypothetical protein [Spirochaetota bacterium]